jgi:8-oxo-dGTP pyrophosphatase MutT (NUDIX family)
VRSDSRHLLPAARLGHPVGMDKTGPVVCQAGGVVVKRRGRSRRILVVRSSDGSDWLFPKGHVERGETPEEAAVREVREEAGVVAEVRAFIGRERFLRGGCTVEVSYYLLDYQGDAPCDEDREARWCTPGQARRLVSFDGLKNMLDRASTAM